jgi:hypothetical protein
MKLQSSAPPRLGRSFPGLCRTLRKIIFKGKLCHWLVAPRSSLGGANPFPISSLTTVSWMQVPAGSAGCLHARQSALQTGRLLSH